VTKRRLCLTGRGALPGGSVPWTRRPPCGWHPRGCPSFVRGPPVGSERRRTRPDGPWVRSIPGRPRCL